MTKKVTVSRFVLLGVCISLVLSLLALLYQSLTSDVAKPNMFVPATPSALIPDDTNVPISPESELGKFLARGRYVALALVNEDGNIKLINRDGAPQPPCFLNGQIVGVGGCNGAASKPSENDSSQPSKNDSDVTIPDTVVLIYATSSSTAFCKTVNVGGTNVRKHNTADPTPNTEAKWQINYQPCNTVEETANYKVHNHQ